MRHIEHAGIGAHLLVLFKLGAVCKACPAAEINHFGAIARCAALSGVCLSVIIFLSESEASVQTNLQVGRN